MPSQRLERCIQALKRHATATAVELIGVCEGNSLGLQQDFAI